MFKKEGGEKRKRSYFFLRTLNRLGKNGSKVGKTSLSYQRRGEKRGDFPVVDGGGISLH